MPDCFIPPYKIHDVGDIETLSQIYPQHIKELNIPKIWSKTKGKGVVVAILDTGIQMHPDLVKNIDISKCRSFIEGEDIFDNFSGHGIHVSGIVASSNDEYGIVGIAPEVTIVSIKVLNKNGRSQNDSILKGLKYCLTLNPDVINMSLGGVEPMPNAHEVIKELVSRDIPIVCSVGNNAQQKNQVLYPAQYDECIAVGSYSNSMMRDRSLFSSHGDTVDVLAPGEEIFSTYLDGKYGVLSGSSMAAPMVSGIIALIISYYKKQNKYLKISELKNIIFNSCIDKHKSGKDEDSGWGIINPDSIWSNITGEKIVKPSFWEKLKKLFRK